MAAARFRVVDRPAEGGPVSWRLLATNNRDLGRSAAGYPDRDACRAAVSDLQKRTDVLRVVTVRTGPSSWSWRLMDGAGVAVVASREYQRRIQAEYAAGVVLTLIPAAELVESVPARRVRP